MHRGLPFGHFGPSLVILGICDFHLTGWRELGAIWRSFALRHDALGQYYHVIGGTSTSFTTSCRSSHLIDIKRARRHSLDGDIRRDHDRSTNLAIRGNREEESGLLCQKGKDVNHDGLPDQVCSLETDATGFQEGDTRGVLTGVTSDARRSLAPTPSGFFDQTAFHISIGRANDDTTPATHGGRSSTRLNWNQQPHWLPSRKSCAAGRNQHFHARPVSRRG